LKETIVIRVENVSKKYCKSLKGSMLYGVMDIGRNMLGFSSHSERLRRGEFWALNEVSLEVNREETLGLIGPNGSGKTTLLKMINGILMPDKGKITVRGRVGALIAVGAGFHPLLTGRENIYIKGAILGMSKREIDRKFSSIVDFADIGDFLDAPIKHYSSGMFVRLGFSVVINSEPDILLVDEVLAVGDKEFQMKCYRKIHEIINEGAAVILVSHNELTILEHSKRCICLESGRIRFAGSSEEVIGAYNREMSQH
jgi:lipopolysaccharide transport system ATP-binding protein